ncbi:DNA-binding protein RFX2-like [Sitophilus oryzae]|uniref:DNA-binding protein RFX2-like n=1 Tax=Sitophilus oryzae TaxID=7048 RepID=A0A6J2YVJ6_SITOR|nr:DNA-binding protein RFX2-like [Sitophilus oryzae]
MATAARFAAGGGGSSPPTPGPATSPPAQSQPTQLIVLPASLHQGTASGTLVNGVPVIALEQTGDSSNESTGPADQETESQEDTIATTSPHFITVTDVSENTYGTEDCLIPNSVRVKTYKEAKERRRLSLEAVLSNNFHNITLPLIPIAVASSDIEGWVMLNCWGTLPTEITAIGMVAALVHKGFVKLDDVRREMDRRACWGTMKYVSVEILVGDLSHRLKMKAWITYYDDYTYSFYRTPVSNKDRTARSITLVRMDKRRVSVDAAASWAGSASPLTFELYRRLAGLMSGERLIKFKEGRYGIIFKFIFVMARREENELFWAYPVYTVGDSTTLYPITNAGQPQGQYYATATPTNAAPNSTTAVTGTTVGYTAATGQYVVQHTVDPEALIPSTRIGAQTGSAEYVATTAGQSTGQVVAVSSNGEEVGSPLGHATRVSPATVQWLLENYETAEGVSLPRSTLYAHYLRHCSENKLEPVNAASFGKLIRSVFLGLRTRRLGTRGNSKYHYYGIRVKPGSSLVNVEDSSSRVVLTSNSSGKAQGTVRPFKRNSESSEHQTSNGALLQHAAYLGDGSNAIPVFPDMHFTEQLPGDCGYEDVDTLKSIYREHLEAFLDAILSLEFNTVESLWREFWRSQYNNNTDECEEEKYLSKSKLFSLCSLEPVQQFIKQVDLVFYQNLIQVLVPDVLKPIPATLTQSIRNFAKNLESWLTSAMAGAPSMMLQIKLSAVSAFSSSLRRYTSLNHLAQAARAVLHNGNQIGQMLADLNRVDFHSVREQASWVCQCDNEIVSRFENDFKLTLQQQNSLEQWASWLKNVVKSALKPYEGRPSFSKAARQFLLKWSFYSSMVIRDLTLRSAASFGSFHLIRLLYDEYMFYLIEHQVAEATGVVPIAVILEGIKQDIMQNSLCIYGNNDSVYNGGKLGCVSPTEHLTKRQKIS